MIVAIGQSDEAYLQFTYSLSDKYPIWQLISAMCLALVVIGFIVGCYILVLQRLTSSAKMKKLNSGLRDPAMIMTVELSKARSAFNEMQLRMGKPI